jgi:hypothetical protein
MGGCAAHFSQLNLPLSDIILERPDSDVRRSASTISFHAQNAQAEE